MINSLQTSSCSFSFIFMKSLKKILSKKDFKLVTVRCDLKMTCSVLFLMLLHRALQSNPVWTVFASFGFLRPDDHEFLYLHSLFHIFPQSASLNIFTKLIIQISKRHISEKLKTKHCPVASFFASCFIVSIRCIHICI